MALVDPNVYANLFRTINLIAYKEPVQRKRFSRKKLECDLELWLSMITSAGGPHSTTHELGGDDVIAGENLGFTYAAVNYTPTLATIGGHVIGIDTVLGLHTTDLTALKGRVFKVTYYEAIDISAGTAGTLAAIPATATIQQDEFGDAGTAVLSTVTGGGKPTYETPLDTNGDAITVGSLNGAGDWVTTDTYADPVVLIYKFTITLENYDNLVEDNVIDHVRYNSFTQGSIPFAGVDEELKEDNANFFWDEANARLGIGLNAPRFDIEVQRVGSANFWLEGTSGAGFELCNTTGGLHQKYMQFLQGDQGGLGRFKFRFLGDDFNIANHDNGGFTYLWDGTNKIAFWGVNTENPTHTFEVNGVDDIGSEVFAITNDSDVSVWQTDTLGRTFTEQIVLGDNDTRGTRNSRIVVERGSPVDGNSGGENEGLMVVTRADDNANHRGMYITVEQNNSAQFNRGCQGFNAFIGLYGAGSTHNNIRCGAYEVRYRAGDYTIVKGVAAGGLRSMQDVLTTGGHVIDSVGIELAVLKFEANGGAGQVDPTVDNARGIWVKGADLSSSAGGTLDNYYAIDIDAPVGSPTGDFYAIRTATGAGIVEFGEAIRIKGGSPAVGRVWTCTDAITGEGEWQVNAPLVTTHNSLTAIQGGAVNEYYHFAEREHTRLQQIQGGGITAGGTDTYTATVNPVLTAYATGDVFTVRFTNANSGAVTLNLNSLGAVSVLKNGTFSLVNGDILAGQTFDVMYDGTNFQLIGRVSTGRPIGNLYISSSANSPIAAANTPEKAAGTTTLIPSTFFDMPADNRLRYTGITTTKFIMTASISVSCANNNKFINAYFAKNGAVLPETKIQRKIANGADVGELGLTGTVELATNDYIEVWVENETDAGWVRLDFMNLVIQ
jgi:hypothetical protein